MGWTRENHRRRSGWNSGGTHGEGRRWIGAEDSEWGRVCGGCPLFSRLRGLGERRELSQRGPGWSPGQKGFWRFLKATERSFFTYMTKSAGDNLQYRPPYSKFWGDVSPLPPRDLRPWWELRNTVTYLKWVNMKNAMLRNTVDTMPP